MNGLGRRRRRRGGATVAGAFLAAAFGLAGCGAEPAGSGDSGAGATSAGPVAGTVTTAPDGVQEITLQTQDDYVFTPSTFTVAPGPVRLTVVNVAEQLTHNFRFTPDAGPEPIDPEIPLLAPGETRTIEFAATVPGDHPFECSFHTQLGQVGTMTVSA
jgi:plastocyanin